MHSLVFQVSRNPISEDDVHDADTHWEALGPHTCDYTRDLDADERTRALEWLAQALGEHGKVNTQDASFVITNKRGILEPYYKRFKEYAAKLAIRELDDFISPWTPDGLRTDLYLLQSAFADESGFWFDLDLDGDGYLTLQDLARDLPENTKLYIGGISDYHM